MRELLDTLCSGSDLSRDGSRALFGNLVGGTLSEVEIAALLVALKAKGESPEEIAGAAEALRASALPLDTGGLDVADTCGTGGDGSGTINVSTAAAMVVAAAGLPVAKHGNRSVSSRCGSADVLEQCGVRIDAGPDVAHRCLREVGACFLFAPTYHPGVRHAMAVRRSLGVRTIFNILGPLANPARPRWQVVGVYDKALCPVLAETLGLLGCDGALVVHGAGLDELALHAETTAALLSGGRVTALTLTPEEAGVARRDARELAGGDAAANATVLREVLGGRGAPAHRDAVALNAGALLWIAGRAAGLREGTAAALDVLRSGLAAARLQRLAEVTSDA